MKKYSFLFFLMLVLFTLLVCVLFVAAKRTDAVANIAIFDYTQTVR